MAVVCLDGESGFGRVLGAGKPGLALPLVMHEEMSINNWASIPIYHWRMIFRAPSCQATNPVKKWKKLLQRIFERPHQTGGPLF